MPTYYMCSLLLPPQIVQRIDRYRKHCLWSNGDINRKGTCLATWEPACRPKDEGGLGIIDIRTQNKALLLKFLDKFFNHADIPWVTLTWNKLYHNTNTPPHARCPVGSFWWKDILKLHVEFRALSHCNLSCGNSVLFWGDVWSDNYLKDLFPHLYSFAKKKKCSVRFYLNHDLSANFSYHFQSRPLKNWKL